MNKPTARNVSWREIAALPRDGADHRVNYGRSPEQFGELRLPRSAGPHPIVIFIHGGCWLNQYSLDHASSISRALANEGYAVWTPEYRRIGDVGGGWPGTFEDISLAVKLLQDLAPEFGLALDRVVAMGHSAGGHLALWLAARRNVGGASRYTSHEAMPLHGVVSLAGIADLLAYEELGNECASSLPGLLGGTSSEQPERWAEVDPIRLLPFGTAPHFIHGENDSIVPLAQSAAMARASGGALHVVEGGGHFDLVSPHADAWHTIARVVKGLLA